MIKEFNTGAGSLGLTLLPRRPSERVDLVWFSSGGKGGRSPWGDLRDDEVDNWILVFEVASTACVRWENTSVVN